MEFSIKSFTLFGGLILTGLSAGLFYAWQVSVIPGTMKINHLNYLETMQSINREILNPRFFLIFFGPILLLAVGSALSYSSPKIVLVLMILATLTYLLGTFGITVTGNVPLNEQLEAMNLSEMSTDKLAKYRAEYETEWNKFHTWRTVAAVLSFVFAALAVFIEFKK
ncbi:MAG: anthrone oxygenase family protein [Bacteroidota bacterium]